MTAAQALQTENISSMIDEILVSMADHLVDDERFMTTLLKDDRAIVVKSSIHYEHLPSLRYIISLEENGEQLSGKLSLSLRPKDSKYLNRFMEFFQVFTEVDNYYNKRQDSQMDLKYELKQGSVNRTIRMPLDSNYVSYANIDTMKLIDVLLKQALLSDVIGTEKIKKEYARRVRNCYFI